MKNNHIKVALVTESLWKMGGSNRVLDIFAEIYPKADIFALFGEKNNLYLENQEKLNELKSLLEGEKNKF